MKKMAMTVSLAFVAGLLTAGMTVAAGETEDKYGATSGEQTQMQQDQQQMETTASTGQQQQIQAAEDLKGAKVQNAQGEELGEVSDLLIDVDKGQVGYAVVKAGGMLGMGDEKYIVPFKALKSGQDKTLVLDMQKDQMKEAPQGDVQQVLDRQKGEEIHQYYGVSPYWEQSGQQQSQQPEEQMEQPSMEEPSIEQPGMEEPSEQDKM